MCLLDAKSIRFWRGELVYIQRRKGVSFVLTGDGAKIIDPDRSLLEHERNYYEQRLDRITEFMRRERKLCIECGAPALNPYARAVYHRWNHETMTAYDEPVPDMGERLLWCFNCWRAGRWKCHLPDGEPLLFTAPPKEPRTKKKAKADQFVPLTGEDLVASLLGPMEVPVSHEHDLDIFK